MLQKIEIKNFQSLVEARLELAGFNCVVGDSNSGKSAFIRALHAIVSARTGNDFITVGATETFVQLEFAKESLIRWNKTQTGGSYVVIKEQVVSKYTKYGHSCPAEVSEALQLGSIDVDETLSFEPNFIQQMDGLFLLSEKGSAAAKILSTVTNANSLLLAVRKANTLAKHSQTKAKVYEEELDKAKKELAGFDNLQGIKARLAEASHATRACIVRSTEIDRLVEQSEKLAELQKAITARAADITKFARFVDLSDRVDELRARFAGLKQLEAIRDAYKEIIQRQAAIEAKISFRDRAGTILDRAGHFRTQALWLRDLEQLAEDYCVVVDAAGRLAKHRLAAQGELDMCNSRLAAFENCPLCGKPMNA